MPSPVGHALAGAAVALVVCRPAAATSVRRFLRDPLTLWSVALATLPDADLLVQGFHRTATHSVFTTLALTIFAIVVTGQVTRQGPGAVVPALERSWPGRIAWTVVIACAAAHGSHVLLDWMGADLSQPSGIQALWPVSGEWYISGWDLFPQIERRQPLSAASMAINVNALVWELVLTGPPVAAIWAWRRAGRSDAEPSA